jgi:hypothetical protein
MIRYFITGLLNQTLSNLDHPRLGSHPPHMVHHWLDVSASDHWPDVEVVIPSSDDRDFPVEVRDHGPPPPEFV